MIEILIKHVTYQIRNQLHTDPIQNEDVFIFYWNKLYINLGKRNETSFKNMGLTRQRSYASSIYTYLSSQKLWVQSITCLCVFDICYIIMFHNVLRQDGYSISITSIEYHQYNSNRIAGVVVSILSLWNKRKDWLLLNRNNMSECSEISTGGL